MALVLAAAVVALVAAAVVAAVVAAAVAVVAAVVAGVAVAVGRLIFIYPLPCWAAQLPSRCALVVEVAKGLHVCTPAHPRLPWQAGVARQSRHCMHGAKLACDACNSQ